jgi:integrase
MPIVNLTDRFCASIKGADRTDYFDEVTKGLALRVPSKTWSYHFTLAGKRCRLTIGSYPATTLAAARTRALEAKALVEAGSDPRRSAAGDMTVAMLVEKYLANHVRINLRRPVATERRIAKNIVPVIGNVRLADLHRRDAARVVDPILKRGAPSEASHTFADLRALLRWAVAQGDLDHNPIQGAKRPTTSKPRERVLSDDEIRTLWRKVGDVMPRCAWIIRLCLVTAQRVGEVTGLRQDELDLNRRLWSMPGSRTKNGHPHSVPLSKLALEIIASRTSDVPNPHAVSNAILEGRGRFGIAPFTAHDLRRTALTQMAQLGVAPIVLGHVANHHTTTKAGMTLSVYVQHAYESEKRQALELWADRLQGIIGGARVVPMVRA